MVLYKYRGVKIIEQKKLKLICQDFISVNHYMSYRAVGKRVMAYKPKTTKDFEKTFSTYVKEEILKQGWIKPPNGKLVIMDTIFYFPRIDMDAQNYFKSLCDILTTCEVWEDDNIVMERVNRIYYDSQNPRIEIEIYESNNVGIFDNNEEYDFFKEKCEMCKRFKNNCSIHKNALKNRIQNDVELTKTGWSCSKFKEIKSK